MKKVRFLLFLILLTASVSLIRPARADDLTVQYHSRSLEGKHVSVEMSLSGTISYDTIDAIRNGITANLLLTVQLMKSAGIFESGKELVAQKTENFTISYDVWENSFLLQDKARKKEYQANSPSDIVSAINQHISPVKMSVSSTKKDQKYLVRARIKIQTIKLFPPFGIFLYFFDPWNYESGWIYSEVFSLETPQG